MTDTDKIALIRTMTPDVTLSDSDLSAYLIASENEILSWMYRLYDNVPEDVTGVPKKYEMTQIQAVITGINLQGAEGETSHNENGINRSFKYADMLQYIHSHVISVAKVGG